MLKCGSSWCPVSAAPITANFLPGEGASDIALALFSFPSLAEYENYRKASRDDPDVAKALDYAKQTRSFLRYDRSFFRPVLS